MIQNKENATKHTKNIVSSNSYNNPKSCQFDEIEQNSIKNIVDRLQQSYLITKSSK